MCEHCGCRAVEPIAQLMDEHYEMLDLSGRIRAQLAAGDAAGARMTLTELGRRLTPHARREERGVFAALKDQGDFAAEVLDLEADHQAFDETLAGLDSTAPEFEKQVRTFLADLSLHIDRENLGVFPVTVVTLDDDGWETVTRAHADGAANTPVTR